MLRRREIALGDNVDYLLKDNVEVAMVGLGMAWTRPA
jgi:hypothetical protein